VLRKGKGAHDKRLHTSELAQTALDGAGAHLLAIWPEFTVEALRLGEEPPRQKKRMAAGTFDSAAPAASWVAVPVLQLQYFNNKKRGSLNTAQHSTAQQKT
jgi:hypothetical protein